MDAFQCRRRSAFRRNQPAQALGRIEGAQRPQPAVREAAKASRKIDDRKTPLAQLQPKLALGDDKPLDEFLEIRVVADDQHGIRGAPPAGRLANRGAEGFGRGAGGKRRLLDDFRFPAQGVGRQASSLRRAR